MHSDISKMGLIKCHEPAYLSARILPEDLKQQGANVFKRLKDKINPDQCDEVIDWVLADLSFTPLAPILHTIMSFTHRQTKLLLLIKPQFELTPKNIAKGGVVTDTQARDSAIDHVMKDLNQFQEWSWKVRPSKILGRKGNQEYFAYGFPEKVGKDFTQ